MARRPPLFRGSELPRLLLLLGIVIVGWPLALVWFSSSNRPAGGEPVPPRPAAQVQTPPPDQSLPFQAIKDKTPLSFTDNAAYVELLRRARETPPAALAAQSTKAVLFSQLWERPERYRGVPIHLEGTVLRVLVHEDLPPNLVPSRRLYEAWVITPDSQNNPLVLALETVPKGFPAGDRLSERFRFDGYFLKLMAYPAGDTKRAAPLLVGHLEWIRYPQFDEEARARSSLRWSVLAMSGLTVYALLRWALHLRRRLTTPPAATHRHIATRPTDQIAPEDLSGWIQQAEGSSDERATIGGAEAEESAEGDETTEGR